MTDTTPPAGANAASTGPFDVAVRMAQIVGHPQRVESLREDQLDEEAKRLTAEIRVAFGNQNDGFIPEVIRFMLVHPALFGPQIEMGIALVGRGRISARERELAVLRNAWLCGAPYEWGQHVDIAKRHGVTPDEIERCTQGSDAPGWDEHDRAILLGVEELHEQKMVSDETWEILARHWDDGQLMEFPVLVGQYLATALLQNSCRVRLPPDNPGLNYR